MTTAGNARTPGRPEPDPQDDIWRLGPPRLPFWQRACDVAFAGVLLLVTAPVILATVAAVGVTMGPPIFFRQRRPGLLAREFTLVKFRTMTNTPSGGASPDGARITRLGAFLRRTSIDELPELITILGGHMSLVGPRPLLPEYVPFYSTEELKRFLVRPGLTGLAQISGRNALNWADRLRLDAEFTERLSPRLYLDILLRTVGKVLWASEVVVDSYAVSVPLHIERANQPRNRSDAVS